jgi:hypothetical protein
MFLSASFQNASQNSDIAAILRASHTSWNARLGAHAQDLQDEKAEALFEAPTISILI